MIFNSILLFYKSINLVQNIDIFQFFAIGGAYSATNMFNRIDGVYDNCLQFRILHNSGL